jgi:hypothetical protein
MEMQHLHLHFCFLALTLPAEKSCILICEFFIFLCLNKAIISVDTEKQLEPGDQILIVLSQKNFNRHSEVFW